MSDEVLYGPTSVIDGSSKTATGTIYCSTYGPSLDSAWDQHYVGDCFNNQLEVVDCANNQVSEEVTVGAGPYDTAADSNAGRVYTANLNDGTVSVLQQSGATTEPTKRQKFRPRKRS